MNGNRVYNFNAGPAALPLEVLEEIKDSFLNYAGSGMSVIEISHRSKWFDDIITDAVARTKQLLKLDNKFQVLFYPGGINHRRMKAQSRVNETLIFFSNFGNMETIIFYR